MADRSEEATASEPGSTEELLEETERLLSESGVEGADAGDSEAHARETMDAVDADPSTADASRSRWRRVRPSRPDVAWPSLAGFAPSAYFSPRAFVALTAAFGGGFLAGGLTIPVAGSVIGLFAVAFLVGLLTTRRRYLEVALAGCSVGAVTAAFNYAVVVAAGVGGRVIVAGVTTGAVACLLGYYFGRDLRSGLDEDV